MRFIIRPKLKVLALADTVTGKLQTLGTEQYVGLPDSKFWNLLKSTGIYDKMRAENKARMDRVEANGVGVLRSEKTIITDAGLTNDTTGTVKPLPGTTDTAKAIATIIR